MSVTLKSAVVHILDASTGLPVISENPIFLDKEVAEYIACVIDKSFYSDDAKECTFRSTPTVWDQCLSFSWNIITISRSIAQEMFNIMRRNREIPAADVIMGISEIDGTDYLYALKFDYREGYTHIVETQNDHSNVNIIRYKTLLPLQAKKVAEGFFINTKASAVKILERKFTIDGIKDFYISTQILACSENKTPRQKATKIMKVAEKVAELYYDSEDTIDAHISSTMLDELQQEHPVVVNNLGQKFFANNPAAQADFFERLAAEDIAKDEELPLSKKFQKKFEKQAIRTLSGVEIKIPTQVYSNSDEIEFINNPDGTISLLIKNIQI